MNKFAPSLHRLLSTGCLVLVFICGCEKQVAEPATDRETALPGDGAPQVPAQERVKAEFGVGAKGKSSNSPIRYAANAYFNATEKLQFMAAQHALDLYKAQDPNGRGPQSHDDYMEKIVEFNRIELPVLPEGHQYVYDPEAGELFVERTAAQSPVNN